MILSLSLVKFAPLTFLGVFFMNKSKNNKKRRGYLIFRASKTVDGKKLYAKDYGLKAFPIWVELKK